MAEFDLVIQNGMVVDGTRMPRFRGDWLLARQLIRNDARRGCAKISPSGPPPVMRRACPAGSNEIVGYVVKDVALRNCCVSTGRNADAVPFDPRAIDGK